MICIVPPQARQVSISIPNTRFRRCAHVITTRRSAGVGSSPSAGPTDLPPPSRFPGVTRARYPLLGANTPWKRVRLTRGLGTSAARRTMKSSGSMMTCVVPSRSNSEQRDEDGAVAHLRRHAATSTGVPASRQSLHARVLARVASFAAQQPGLALGLRTPQSLPARSGHRASARAECGADWAIQRCGMSARL